MRGWNECPDCRGRGIIPGDDLETCRRDILSQEILDLELSTRALSGLRELGLTTFPAVAKTPARDLRRSRFIGAKTSREIRMAVASRLEAPQRVAKYNASAAFYKWCEEHREVLEMVRAGKLAVIFPPKLEGPIAPLRVRTFAGSAGVSSGFATGGTSGDSGDREYPDTDTPGES